jgi:hypothetical protein
MLAFSIFNLHTSRNCELYSPRGRTTELVFAGHRLRGARQRHSGRIAEIELPSRRQAGCQPDGAPRAAAFTRAKNRCDASAQFGWRNAVLIRSS